MGVSNGVSVGVSKGVSNGVSVGVSKGVSNGVSEGVSVAASEATSVSGSPPSPETRLSSKTTHALRRNSHVVNSVFPIHKPPLTMRDFSRKR